MRIFYPLKALITLVLLLASCGIILSQPLKSLSTDTEAYFKEMKSLMEAADKKKGKELS